MEAIVNGISATDIPDVQWRKSSYSGAQGGNCVEVTPLPTGSIAMRNSRDPEGPALIFTHDEMAAFVAGAKDGEFDLPDHGDMSSNLAHHDPAPSDHVSTPSRYEVISSEVQKLTGLLLEGHTVLDRESSERLLRVLSGVALLQRMHRVDRHGNCTICRPKSRRWHPASRHDVCSVHAALNLYLGHALMASTEPEDADEPAWSTADLVHHAR